MGLMKGGSKSEDTASQFAPNTISLTLDTCLFAPQMLVIFTEYA